MRRIVLGEVPGIYIITTVYSFVHYPSTWPVWKVRLNGAVAWCGRREARLNVRGSRVVVHYMRTKARMKRRMNERYD